MTDPLLQVSDLHVAYGAVEVLEGVSLDVHPGECVTLLGANGAGKSTLLRSICGLLPARAGAVRLGGRRITKLPAHEIVTLGMSHSPEGRMCFGRLTVHDNLVLGAYLVRDDDALVRSRMATVFELFPRLRDRRDQQAGTMSGGEQQMLAIGRAMMSDPRLLLLDEPSMGIAPLLVERTYATIADISRQGTTILLVEQNAHHAMEVASRGYVLETGRVVLSGPVSELRSNPEVQAAYLGG